MLNAPTSRAAFAARFLSLLVFSGSALAQSGTFDFSTQAPACTGTLFWTVSGVTLTATAPNGVCDVNYGDFFGMTGDFLSAEPGEGPLTLSFSQPVNISTLRAGDGAGAPTWVFTPDPGTAVTQSIDVSGTTVTLNFVGITSITITPEGGGEFWPFIDNIVMDGALPVELSSFTGMADGEDVVLHWETASETNNAGFEVQHRAMVNGQPIWHPLAFVAGQGTTPEAQSYTYRAAGIAPGTHRFRLRQVDHDGAFAYSAEVEVAVAWPGPYHLSAAYPNPFNPQTTFALAVAAEQRVRVAVFDVLGRQVAVLHDGLLGPGDAHRFTYDAAGLPGGAYLLHVAGAHFHATQTLVLVK